MPSRIRSRRIDPDQLLVPGLSARRDPAPYLAERVAAAPALDLESRIALAADLQATAGRSITMLDLKTGEILAQKHLDVAGLPAGDDPTAVAYDPLEPERSMVFAIASTPGVYDIDSDGYADAVYFGDLGGNLWKWVIKDVGDDVINGATGTTDQSRWHFEKFFAAVSKTSQTRYWSQTPNEKTANATRMDRSST